MRVFAKVSSYHLCAASDDYYSRAKEVSGQLTSFVVAFDASAATAS